MGYIELSVEQFTSQLSAFEEARMAKNVKQYSKSPDEIQFRKKVATGLHAYPCGESAGPAKRVFESLIDKDWFCVADAAKMANYSAKRLNAFSRNLTIIARQEGYETLRKVGQVNEGKVKQKMFIKFSKIG